MKDYIDVAKEAVASYHEKMHPDGRPEEYLVLSASMGARGWQAVIMTKHADAIYMIVYDGEAHMARIEGYGHSNGTEGVLHEPKCGRAYVSDSWEEDE